MHIIKSKSSNEYTTQLQGVGHVYGTPASELKIGSTIIWNFGSTSKVTSIIKETKAFVHIMLNDGDRKLKKTRIVARPADELSKGLQLRGNYPKTFKDLNDLIAFYEVFPEFLNHIEHECYSLAYHILVQHFIELPDRSIVEAFLLKNKNIIASY